MISSTAIRTAATALALLASGTAAQAETVFAVTSGNRLVSFDAATPGTLKSNAAISGLAIGDTLIGIDLRPADRKLYAVGRSGNLYRLAGGGNGYAATNLGQIGAALSGSSFGVDFNPTVDRLRLVSDSNQNLRINPNIMPPGTITDASLTLNGAVPFDLLAAAYTNSRPGALTTTLYGIDARSGGLVRATNANAGTYVTTSLGGAAFQSLGLPLDNAQSLGFDISGGTGLGYFNFGDSFYRISLSTGASTLVGGIGASGIVGLTAGSVPEPASWALLIMGFGLVGAARRRQRPAQARLSA
ncbi:DUF4394 domain-containing protein [Sandarakinorhabdus sp.]|uniref:DUF4394 domain-containing protein n=1 Tax=Sandarakinorhabdus sp. TaxID=1916663 RepID=UPI00286E3ED8|nr:DUF4394 domain-containing protein [Sandarakinorhabdus sp.]